MEGLTALCVGISGVVIGAFGGRTGMLMLWKMGMEIVECEQLPGVHPLSGRAEASSIGLFYGGLLGFLISILAACMSQAYFGLLLSAVVVPLGYAVIFNGCQLLGWILGGLVHALRRASDALVGLVPGEPKED